MRLYQACQIAERRGLDLKIKGTYIELSFNGEPVGFIGPWDFSETPRLVIDYERLVQLEYALPAYLL